jgi:glycosyltransferase involved in cell wall biosynthesis
MRPVLSVLIDTYNHEKYIEQAIVSAIEQEFPADDYEIVVVDDGSTDRTPEIVRKFGPRVRLLRKENGGQASAFNAAIPELQGEIVAFLDGDDWFAPGKLTAVMTALDEHPEAAAIGHGYFDYRGGDHETKVRAPAEAGLLDLSTPEAAREACANWYCLLMGALTVRRQVLQRCGPVPEVLRFCGDAPFSIVSLVQGVWAIPEPLFYYRRHVSNLFALDTQDRASIRRRWEMIWLTFDCLEQLLPRLGARAECTAEFLHAWAEMLRVQLCESGGDRMDAFRTELALFRTGPGSPSISYKMFKYLVVGATLLFTPKRFYQGRDWYARRDLRRVRERFAGSR